MRKRSISGGIKSQLGSVLFMAGLFITGQVISGQVLAEQEMSQQPAQLNWDNLIQLDAEDLAEGAGIKQSYQTLVLPLLKQYVDEPLDIKEVLDPDTGYYKVIAGQQQYVIYDPDKQDTPLLAYYSRGYATHALFAIVNQQLANSEYRFYAVNSGNDLAGIFLTEPMYQHYYQVLHDNDIRSMPYIPTTEPSWFGQPHDFNFKK